MLGRRMEADQQKLGQLSSFGRVLVHDGGPRAWIIEENFPGQDISGGLLGPIAAIGRWVA